MATKTKNPKSKTNNDVESADAPDGRLCACYSVEGDKGVRESCGQEVKGKKSVFRPGHDARWKGVLIDAHRDGKTVRILDVETGKVRIVDPMEAAAERGWEHFLLHERKPRKSRAKSKNTKTGTGKGKPRGEGASEPDLRDDLSVGTMVGFRVGRAEYVGEVIATKGGNVEVRYEDRKGKSHDKVLAAGKVTALA